MSVRYTLEGLYRESLRWGQEERIGKTLCFTEKNKQNRLKKKNRIPSSEIMTASISKSL